MNPNNTTFSVNEALLKLQSYCAYQDRCHQEVTQKLKKMRMIPEAIDSIMVTLISQDYLNESRFATNYVRGKFRIKKWGKRRLIFELKKKDMGNVIINQAIKEIDEDTYIQVFNELAEKHYEQIKETNVFKKKKKLIDYLLYRGWESHLVYEKVNKLAK